MRSKAGPLFAATLLTAACVVDNISGPSTVAPNTVATYRMTFHMGSCLAAAYQIYGVLLIDVPTGWQFQGASFSGTVNGAPTSGVGELVPGCSASPWGSPAPPTPPGYTRLCVQTPTTLSYLPSDSVQVSVSLLSGTAVGQYTLQWFGAGYSSAGHCIQPSPSLFAVSVEAPTAPSVYALSFPTLLLFTFALAISGLAVLRWQAP